jgi:Beta protein
MATDWRYLPILKWKQGERIALEHLSPPQWEGIVPLIELMSVAAAPDGASLRSALPSYLQKHGKQFQKTFPEDKAVAVDVRYVSPAYPRQVRLLQAVCARLQKEADRRVIPTLTESMVAAETPDLPLVKDYAEHALRIHMPGVDPTQIKDLVDLVRAAGIRKNALHLILDQHSIVDADPAGRLPTIKPYLAAAIATGCASVTLSGGSFPINLVGIKQGQKDIQRVEWLMWKSIAGEAAYEGLRYGDYAVTNPALGPDLDPTTMNPSVAIRYASDGFWRLFKAGGFKKGKPNQYRSLCQLLLGDIVYSGATFSYGDDCYDKAANATLGNGNPSSWRRDATSHHLVLTASHV